MPSRASRYGANRGSIAASSPTRFQTWPSAAERRVFGVVQLRVALAAQPLNGVGAAQQLAIGGERLVLARLQVGLLQFAQLELDEIETRRPLAVVHPQPIELLAQAAHRRERARHLRAWRLEARPRIQQREMLGGIEQLLMFVLAVQLDQPIRQILERRGGGQRAVDEGAAAALRGDLAAHDQLAAVFGFEDRFDGGDVFAGANQILRGASAEQQADRLDEDGLAGAGLAGQDVERLFKIDGDRLDDRKVADGQVADHEESFANAELPSYHWFDRISHGVLRLHARALSQQRIPMDLIRRLCCRRLDCLSWHCNSRESMRLLGLLPEILRT